MATKQEFVPNPGQQEALDSFKAFLKSNTSQVFILTGYAGTGKTTILTQFIKLANRSSMRPVLLASTGRAAKVMTAATGASASTVHSLLYKFVGLNKDLDKYENQPIADETGQLLLNFSMNDFPTLDDDDEQDTRPRCYIVDEASMVGDTPQENPTQAVYGSGRLLSDLLRFDPMGKYVFVGDDAQLPPVAAEAISPALSADYIASNFGMHVKTASLTQVMRQDDDNDIVESATRVREMVDRTFVNDWIKFPLRGYRDITIHNSIDDMIEAYVDDLRENGYGHAVMISDSNTKCRRYAQQIRPKLGFHGSIVAEGDLLLVTQNNLISRLMNGDLVKVVKIGSRERRATLTFVNVEVESTTSGEVFSQLLIEDIIYGGHVNLTSSQLRELLMDFHARMKKQGIKQKSKAYNDNMRTDDYLNALRCVYGYVITCHKSQGGEWPQVYLDIPRKLSRRTQSEGFRWLYTAMTRAIDELHIVDDFYVAQNPFNF